MAVQVFVRAVNMTTREETIEGPFPTESAAVAFAETWAESFYGGDDVTWYEAVPKSNFLVGRIAEDGSRSNPMVTITIEEESVEIEEDPSIESAPGSM